MFWIKRPAMGQTLERIRTDIQTPRLRLRTPVASDAAAIAMLASDFDVSRMTARMPHPYLRIDAEGFISRAAQSASFDAAELMAISASPNSRRATVSGTAMRKKCPGVWGA